MGAKSKNVQLTAGGGWWLVSSHDKRQWIEYRHENGAVGLRLEQTPEGLRVTMPEDTLVLSPPDVEALQQALRLSS